MKPRLLIAALLLLSLFCACGKQENAAKTETTTSTASAPAASDSKAPAPFAQATAATTPAEAGDLGFTFVKPPATLKIGDSAKLEVKGVDLSKYEFQWSVKDGSKPWDSKPWGDATTFDFAPTTPGRWAVEVDIREKSTQKVILKKWLGEALTA